MRFRHTPAILAFILAPLTVTSAFAQQNNLHVVVDSGLPDNWDFVGEATALVTNLTNDRVILLESVEFEGQLPETRYFYHGVVGDLKKFSKLHKLNIDRAFLSEPVAWAVLLPNQTFKWKRPYRFGYNSHAIIKYRELPLSDTADRVFPSALDFAPLTEDRRGQFLSVAASVHEEVYSIIKDFEKLQQSEAKYDVVEFFNNDNWCDREDDAEVRNKCGLGNDTRIIRHSDLLYIVYERTRAYTLMVDYLTDACTRSSSFDLTVADLMLIELRKSERKVPVVLHSRRFEDLVTAAEPKEERYLQPPVNSLGSQQLSQILLRASSLDIKPTVQRIDPNSINQQLVLCIGTRVSDRGFRIE